MQGRNKYEGPSQNILLNGCFRSGTTLLDKLLHAHPQIIMASQPFPNLYFYMKEAFMKKRQLPFRYPLDHMFKQNRYSPDDFSSFLSTYEINDEDIDAIFERS